MLDTYRTGDQADLWWTWQKRMMGERAFQNSTEPIIFLTCVKQADLHVLLAETAKALA